MTAEVKDDPALGWLDDALNKIEKLHEKGGCFFPAASCSLQENMMSMFEEIEKKAFVVQEEYKKTQEVFVPLHCTPGWPPIYLRFLIRISLFGFT